MLLNLMKAKIHQATVTEALLDYEGSIAIDEALLQEAGIRVYEQVHVYDITNGARLITYAIPAPAHSGKISINGAAARLVSPGDKVIIVAYCQYEEREVPYHRPRVLLLNDQNKIKTN